MLDTTQTEARQVSVCAEVQGAKKQEDFEVAATFRNQKYINGKEASILFSYKRTLVSWKNQ